MGDFEKVIAWNEAVGPTFKTLRLRAERADAERDEARAALQDALSTIRTFHRARIDRGDGEFEILRNLIVRLRAALVPVPHPTDEEKT